jgi:hypothetical protein
VRISRFPWIVTDLALFFFNTISNKLAALLVSLLKNRQCLAGLYAAQRNVLPVMPMNTETG